nr:hypothetical protein [Microbacterium sp. NIBRBAC000506063]
MLELALVLVLSEQEAAVGDAQPLPAVAGEPAAALDHAGGGEQERVDAELLGGVLDPDEEGAVEVAAAARERLLVGEHTEDLVAAARETLGERVRRVAGDADRVEHARAGLLRDAHADRGVAVEDEADGRLAHARDGGDVGLRDAMARHPILLDQRSGDEEQSAGA